LRGPCDNPASGLHNVHVSDPAAVHDDAAAARRLAQRVTALPDLGMRQVALAEALTAPGPAAAVALLAALLRASRETPGHPYTATLAALAGMLSDATLLPYIVRESIYEAALVAERPDIARLLLEAPAGPGEPKPPGPERPIAPRGRPLTLGERKSLARTPRRDLIQRLLVDPDAQVIRVLLGNPHVTEGDVLDLASRRPARREVLRVVFESAWLARYAVKRALVLNPYTPGDLAVRLLPTLAMNDLRALASDPAASEPLRTEARLLIELGSR
jgi:hypothetical protein